MFHNNHDEGIMAISNEIFDILREISDEGSMKIANKRDDVSQKKLKTEAH